jgi:hypothetical protein
MGRQEVRRMEGIRHRVDRVEVRRVALVEVRHRVGLVEVRQAVLVEWCLFHLVGLE